MKYNGGILNHASSLEGNSLKICVVHARFPPSEGDVVSCIFHSDSALGDVSGLPHPAGIAFSFLSCRTWCQLPCQASANGDDDADF